MLGSELKRLIRLYEKVLYNNDGLPELMSVDESVLSEMIIDEEDTNFLDEEKLSILYDVAVLDYPNEFKKEVISAFKGISLSKIELINPLVETLYEALKSKTGTYIKELCNRKLTNEEIELIVSYIDELVGYDAHEDISLDFLQTAPDYLMNLIIKIKCAITSYASSDVKRIELLLSEVIKNCDSEDVDIASEYSIMLQIFLEKIEVFDWEVGTSNDKYEKEEFEKKVSEVIDSIFVELIECVRTMNTERLSAIIDYITLLDLNEIDVCNDAVNIMASLDEGKIICLYNIYKNMGLVIDLEEDAKFLEQLSELEIGYLEQVEIFSSRFCKNSYEPYEHAYLYTDTHIIDRYDDLTRILKKNRSTDVESLFDLSDTLELEIEYAIDDEEGLEEVLSTISDDEEIVPAMLKFTHYKGKK